MHGMLHAESNSEAEHATNAAHQIWPSNERNSKEYGQFCQANLFDWLHWPESATPVAHKWEHLADTVQRLLQAL